MSASQLIQARSSEIGQQRAGHFLKGAPRYTAIPRRFMLAIAWVLFSAFLVTVYAATAGVVYDHDCFGYAETAKQLLQGKSLYSETWMDKPPLAILFYAIPQLVIPRSYLAIQAALGCWISLQVLLLFLFTRGSDLFARGAAAGLLGLVPLTKHDFVWASSEHIANLFVLVCFLLALQIAMQRSIRSWQCLLMGICVAMAFHSRQNSAVIILCPIVAILTCSSPWPTRWFGLLWMAAGGAIGWAMVISLVASIGDLQGYSYTVFVYPKLYAEGSGGLRDALKLLDYLRSDAFGIVLFSLAIFALATPYRIALTVALVVSVISCLAPLKCHGHYWVQAIPACGLAFFAWLMDSEPAVRRIKRLFAVALLAFLGLSASWTTACAVAKPTVWKFNEVAQVLNESANSDDRLFVVGRQGVYLYFASEVTPAHTFFWDMQLDRFWSRALPRPIDDILQEYRNDPASVLAIEEIVLNHIRSDPTGTAECATYLGPNVRSLIDWYLKHGDYQQVANCHGWVILKSNNWSQKS